VNHLALFELRKKSRGAVLGWAWFFIKPATYIFCFWFALDVGLKAGSANPSDSPYIVWLSAGILPWFFMQEMLGTGANVFKRYSYLVTKIKFPLPVISMIYTKAMMLIEVCLIGVLCLALVLTGCDVDIYLLQVPLLLVMLMFFWDTFSIMVSPMSALSKDFHNLLIACSTPLFWLSGILFDVKSLPFDWMQTVLYFNPCTFFTVAFRDAFYDKVWFWDDPALLGGFIAVAVAQIIVMCLTTHRFEKEVPDAL
jgi:teichoic acid transport system permease protein